MADGRTSSRRSDSPFSPISGLTLVETLLAVAITALVIGLIYSIYHTTLTVVTDQQTRIAGPVAAMSGLSRLSRDLACSLKTADESTAPYQLLQSKPFSEVSFFSAVTKEGEEPAWYDIERVTYRVPADGPLSGDLVREHQPIVGPGAQQAAITNSVVTGVTSFDVVFFDGDQWVQEWPGSDASAVPRAARISIEIEHKGGRKSFDTDVFIPAGNVITSSLERVALGG